jgi:chemosensory pili system protein ChpA (sensor histidine kinase/response regulator)
MLELCFQPLEKGGCEMSTKQGPGRADGEMERRDAAARLRLLFVDDEPAMREVASAVLAEHGYDVLTAGDGLDALHLLADPLPDLVISDLTMPRMSGFELLEVVRERFPLVPVIAISGEFAKNELPAGVLADAFFSKGGYTIDQLCGKITELMSARPIRQRG